MWAGLSRCSASMMISCMTKGLSTPLAAPKQNWYTWLTPACAQPHMAQIIFQPRPPSLVSPLPLAGRRREGSLPRRAASPSSHLTSSVYGGLREKLLGWSLWARRPSISRASIPAAEGGREAANHKSVCLRRLSKAQLHACNTPPRQAEAEHVFYGTGFLR